MSDDKFKIPPWALKQRQSLPLEAKIKLSQARIQDWYTQWDGNVHVSFSGGKDSTVLLHLVRDIFPDVTAVYIDTGLEYPEIKEFVKTFENVEYRRPKMSFRQVVDQHGWPVVSKRIAQYIRQVRTTKSEILIKQRLTGINRHGVMSPMSKIPEKWQPLINSPFKISEKCCHIMKKEPLIRYEKETGSKPFVGLMACESRNREVNYMKNGCNGFDLKHPMSTPIAFWTQEDILNYIEQFDLKMASIYGGIQKDFLGCPSLTGVENTGCMFCAMGVHMDPTPNRFIQMKKTHPQLWDYIINKMGLGEVLDFMKIPYGKGLR